MKLGDHELIAELGRLVVQERHSTAAVLAHLAEFDARRLYLGAGFSSLFGYCTRALRFSEQGAYNRIEAARATRSFPVILDYLRRGSVSLTNLRLLAPHLTRENHESLLSEASGKSRLQLEELLARYFPQPPVASSVRKLPAHEPCASESSAQAANVSGSGESAATSTGASAAGTNPPLAPPGATPGRPVVPLAIDRYKVTFTANAETWRRLRQAQELLRHQIPNGDLADVVDRALSALIDKLTRRKFAAVTRARASDWAPTASGRHIPAEVRRSVWLRDGGSCAFVSADGRRCGERGFVEFHHRHPYAVNGGATVTNISLRCRSHNTYEADQYFGASRCFAATAEPP